MPEKSVGASGSSGWASAVSGPVPVTQDRAKEDQAAESFGVSLGEPGGEETPHRVADHHHGQAPVGLHGDVEERGQIVDDMFEVGDEGVLAVAVAVALMVLGVDRSTLIDESSGEVAVAGCVVGVAVNDHDEPLGRTLRGPSLEVDLALRPYERRHAPVLVQIGEATRSGLSP